MLPEKLIKIFFTDIFRIGISGATILSLLISTAQAQHITKRKIRKMIGSSQISAEHFTGFALYDQDEHKMIYELNADKHFIPASNTKLYTFYTALNMLGDSIPGLRYITKGDSLIFWGTGDPSLLHSYFKSTAVFELLKNTSKKLFYCPYNYSGNFYGLGWPYGNYNDYYQVEITAMPLEDNVAVFSADSKGSLSVHPTYFRAFLHEDSSLHPRSFTVRRDLYENKFVYPARPVPKGFTQEIPWKTSPALAITLLQDTLKKTVEILELRMPDSAKIIYSIAADSLYRRMLLPSDNFIAEQLLLVCSSTLPGPLDTRTAIEYSKKHFLNDLPDSIQWVDGSGLSRQDLFTPRTMVALLLKIYNKVGNEQRLHALLPTGGLTGTIQNAYKTDNGVPFVWAKTGSLSNNHNQSGYVITRKGKKLIYSFMNNNFIRSTTDIRNEMVRIITDIHNRF